MIGKDDLHGATAICIAADKALLFEDIELVLDRGGGVEPGRFADFSHGGGIALALGGALDEFEDRHLAGGQLRLGCRGLRYRGLRGGVLGHTQIVPQVGDKFKQMFELFLQMSVGGYMVFLSNKCSKTFPKVLAGSRRRTMSAITIDTSKVIDFQGFSANPSGISLNRRGRLARTVVVLSLAIVLGSVVSAKAGAGTEAAASKAYSFITVTVAPGDTVWSLANRVAAGGDVRSLVSEIISANSLASVDLTAGQKLRIPLS